MRKVGHGTARRAVVLAVAAVFAMIGAAAWGQEILYDGQFTLNPNGDLDMVLKLTLPMEQYQRMRDSISNLYLFLRDLSSNRANVEVTEKNAGWDDPTRTLTFTIHMLGAARNMGTHWTFDVGPGAIFSNLDEAKKTVYFNESGNGIMGPMRGTSRLQLPTRAAQCKYDSAKKIVSYVLPASAGGGGGSGLLLPAGALIVAGLGMFGASFVVGRKPKAKGTPQPPAM